MRTSESINEIAAALAKAQGAIEGAVKGKENPHFRSKYADLGAVWDACREHLSKNGIAVVQPINVVESPDRTAAVQVVLTRLVHGSGQWIEDGGTPLLLSKQDMQGLGSAITYARRYGLMSMVGIAPEDDDGNAAVQKSNGQTASAKPEKPKGFDDWYTDLKASADEGTEKLRATWTASKPELRRHLASVDPEAWEGLKAKAAQRELAHA